MNAVIEGQTLSALDADRYAGAQFLGCTFEDLRHEGAALRSMTFEECDFRACNLRTADVTDSRFIDCRFLGCNLMGVDWTRAQWGRQVLHPPLHFAGCSLDFCTFSGLPLRGVTLYACSAKDASFDGCDLSSADLRFTDFATASFADAVLEEADLVGAQDCVLPIDRTRLRGCRMSTTGAEPLLRQLGVELVLVHPDQQAPDEIVPPRA